MRLMSNSSAFSLPRSHPEGGAHDDKVVSGALHRVLPQGAAVGGPHPMGLNLLLKAWGFLIAWFSVWGVWESV